MERSEGCRSFFINALFLSRGLLVLLILASLSAPGEVGAQCGVSCPACERRYGCMTESWGRCCVQFYQPNGKRHGQSLSGARDALANDGGALASGREHLTSGKEPLASGKNTWISDEELMANGRNALANDGNQWVSGRNVVARGDGTAVGIGGDVSGENSAGIGDGLFTGEEALDRWGSAQDSAEIAVDKPGKIGSERKASKLARTGHFRVGQQSYAEDEDRNVKGIEVRRGSGDFADKGEWEWSKLSKKKSDGGMRERATGVSNLEHKQSMWNADEASAWPAEGSTEDTRSDSETGKRFSHHGTNTRKAFDGIPHADSMRYTEDARAVKKTKEFLTRPGEPENRRDAEKSLLARMRADPAAYSDVISASGPNPPAERSFLTKNGEEEQERMASRALRAETRSLMGADSSAATKVRKLTRGAATATRRERRLFDGEWEAEYGSPAAWQAATDDLASVAYKKREGGGTKARGRRGVHGR